MKDENDNVIQGPWKSKDVLLEEKIARQKDENYNLIVGPWKSKDVLLEEKIARQKEELSHIRELKDQVDKAYTSYRNRICGATVLIGEGTLMMINDLTDMSPISYVLMIPAMLALGRYLTKEQRQRWKEQMAYLSREEN